MKTTTIFRISTPFIIGLFILSFFSGSVCALTPGEQYEKIKEQNQIINKNYDNTKNQFKDAKDILEEANKRFRNATDNTSKEELQIELREKARQYVTRAINYTRSHLQVMKIKIDIPENKGLVASGAIKIIDAHLDQLEDLEVKANQATTIQEIRDVHKELKNLVVKINLETRYFMGIVLNHRIDNFIIKADNVSVKLDGAIEEMKANGNDTTKLEEYSEEFKKDMEQAKGIQAQTLALFKTHSGFAADGMVIDEKNAREFLRKAHDLQKTNILKLKEAGKELIKFQKEYRKLAGKSNNDELEAIGGSAAMTATPAQTATQGE